MLITGMPDNVGGGDGDDSVNDGYVNDVTNKNRNES